MEEEIIATLEGLAEAIENREEPLVFQQGEQHTFMILGSDFGIGRGGKGSGGGESGYELVDSQLEPLDSKEEEEDKEEEDMAEQNLEWMSQGPLALSGAFHRMPNLSERMLTKNDPDSTVKAKDHLESYTYSCKHLWYGTTMLHADFFYVPWMAAQQYGITTFLSNPSITGSC